MFVVVTIPSTTYITNSMRTANITFIIIIIIITTISQKQIILGTKMNLSSKKAQPLFLS